MEVFSILRPVAAGVSTNATYGPIRAAMATDFADTARYNPSAEMTSEVISRETVMKIAKISAAVAVTAVLAGLAGASYVGAQDAAGGAQLPPLEATNSAMYRSSSSR